MLHCSKKVHHATLEITEYDLSDCACNDDFTQLFREAFESGDVLRQLEELETLEAMEFPQ